MNEQNSKELYIYIDYFLFEANIFMQKRFFKSLGDVAAVLLHLVHLSFFLFLHVISDRLDDGDIIIIPAVVRLKYKHTNNITGLLQVMGK